MVRFAEGLLGEVLRPGDIVVADNLAAHKSVGVREAVEAPDADVLKKAATRALKTVSHEDIRNWLGHSNYRIAA